MSETPKNNFDLQLASAVGAGILGALAAYKLAGAVLDWEASGWSELSDQQRFGLDIALTLVLLLVLRFLLRRFGMRRVVVGAGMSLLLAGAVMFATVSISHYREQKAEAASSARAAQERKEFFRTHPRATEADYGKEIVEQMMRDGMLPDQPNNSRTGTAP